MNDRDRSSYQYDYPEEGLCPYSIGNKFCSLLSIRGACETCEVYKNVKV
jgi:hypothetical protein